jgi:hypothetical protein
MKTPIVLIIFRRPDQTLKVFEKIRQVKPSKLFIISDAPRPEKLEEWEKCQQARAITETVDWDCEIFRNYADTNLGTFQRITSGLNWVFEQVEEAIILEDDCLPDLSFFQFCEELLDCYRNDQRIMMISGNNFQLGYQRTRYSYYFSRYTHTWGWATWKRAWIHLDTDLKNWPEVRDKKLLKLILEHDRDVKYWESILQETYDSKIQTWDYRWTFSAWLQNGLTILPNVNLISNIGFGDGATHTFNANNPFSNLPTQSMNFPLQHPPFIIRDSLADAFTQSTMYDPSLEFRIKRKLKLLTNLFK